jgi:hypothetical protein
LGNVSTVDDDDDNDDGDVDHDGGGWTPKRILRVWTLEDSGFWDAACSLMILRKLAARLGSGETLLRSTEEAKIDLISDCAPSKFDSYFLSIEANNLEIFVCLNIS